VGSRARSLGLACCDGGCGAARLFLGPGAQRRRRAGRGQTGGPAFGGPRLLFLRQSSRLCQSRCGAVPPSRVRNLLRCQIWRYKFLGTFHLPRPIWVFKISRNIPCEVVTNKCFTSDVVTSLRANTLLLSNRLSHALTRNFSNFRSTQQRHVQ
jgi:hypothetical protein